MKWIDIQLFLFICLIVSFGLFISYLMALAGKPDSVWFWKVIIGVEL